MRRRETIYVIATTVILLLAMTTIVQPLMSSGVFFAVCEETHAGDSMWVEPSLINMSTDTASVGDRFNVTVWINLTVASTSWEFNLIYNKNHLNATGCGYTAGDKSDFFKDIPATIPLTPTFGVVNSTHSLVLHGEVAFMSTRDPGHGSLGWIEFEVMALPPEGEAYTSKLDIASSYPGDTYAQDADQAKIALNVLNSNYRISAPGAPPPPPGETVLYVNPPNITDPTMGPSSVFSINVAIANVSDMRICEFNLTYNPDIIGFFGVNIFKVQDQVPTIQIMLDDNAGFIWMELTYPTGITTESSDLVAITFHVESYGASVLDLHDTIITDSNGDPIPHEVQDGLFLTLICDVAIIDVYTSRNSTYAGFDINVTAIAKNLGGQNETFAVTAYYDSFEIGNAAVVDLQPSEEAAFIFVWNTQNVTPCTNYTISARASIVPYELNTTNNEYIDGQVTIRILGDTNGDGKVRVDDVYIAASAFGSSVGSPRWEPAADINGDGIIRVDDIFLIASNFGTYCPP